MLTSSSLDLSPTKNPSKLIPAATILLLREHNARLEVLMLRRNRALKAFAGAWVFPGGRVDPEDGRGQSVIERARIAAIRETAEETSLDISMSSTEALSNWIPPAAEIRRFSTWFFIAEAPASDVLIDHGEIHDFQWVNPAEFIQKIPSPDITLFPPTYVSLHQIKDFLTPKAALSHFAQTPPAIFKTKFAKSDSGYVTYWQGDAAYETDDLDSKGPRNRLHAGPNKWTYTTEP